MKLICDCGNEMEFKGGEEGYSVEDKGQYVKQDISKFNTWSGYYEIGIVCQECDKAIWWFK